MERIALKNKPLVEAIFELQWQLEERELGFPIDPHIKLLVGRMYDRLESEYPFHQQLPIARLPDEVAPYVVRHRFRIAENKWPLVQLGPGVVTLNDTEEYNWDDFERRASQLVDTLFDAHPNSEHLVVRLLKLRYIDAVDFDYERDSIWDFLKHQLKADVSILPSLFENTGVSQLPLSLDVRLAFPSTQPKGAINLRFVRGERRGRDVLLWETESVAKGENAPKTRDEIGAWVDQAYHLTHNWFFKMIAGELLERFEPCTPQE